LSPTVLWVVAYIRTYMTRKTRLNFSLAPDVVTKLDKIPEGKRTAFVEESVRENDLPEEYTDE